MRIYSFLVCLLLLSFASLACADGGNGDRGFIVKKSGIEINWGSGLISSSSEILPMQDTIDPMRTKALAVRQSGIKARKNLLDSILGLSLNSKTKVELVIKDDIKSSMLLRGLVQNSLLSTQDTADEMVKVTASMNIYGELSSIIIPATLPFLSGIPPTLSESRSNDDYLETALPAESVPGASSFSGVIIDARDLELIPVLLPIIYDGKGVGVYGPFAVSRESVIKNGLVSYVVDTPYGNLRERVGNAPLVVKPVSTQGIVRGNVILSLSDAAKVRAALKRKSIIDNCAVAIMVNGSKAEVDTQNADIPGAFDAGTVQGDKISSDNNGLLQEDSIIDEGASPALQQ